MGETNAFPPGVAKQRTRELGTVSTHLMEEIHLELERITAIQREEEGALLALSKAVDPAAQGTRDAHDPPAGGSPHTLPSFF